MSSGGKGDKRRPEDRKKLDDGWAKIDWSKKREKDKEGKK